MYFRDLITPCEGVRASPGIRLIGDESAHLRIVERLGERMRSGEDLLQDAGALAEMLVGVSEVDGSSDQRHVRLVVNVSLAQSGVDERRLVSTE